MGAFATLLDPRKQAEHGANTSITSCIQMEGTAGDSGSYGLAPIVSALLGVIVGSGGSEAQNAEKPRRTDLERGPLF